MFKIWGKIGNHGLALFSKEMQHIIFYAHIHACSTSYSDEE